MPVPLPLNLIEHVDALEIFLKDSIEKNRIIAYLSTFGGAHLKSRTNRVMQYLLTNHIACSFNFYGRNRKEAAKIEKREKRAFSELQLCNVVIDSVQKNTEYDKKGVEDAIKLWLKYAPARIKNNNISV